MLRGPQQNIKSLPQEYPELVTLEDLPVPEGEAPAHRVALGIAALAAMSPEGVETALEQGGSGFRPGPRWWAELHRVRDGVVVRDGDHTAGMVSVAAAVGAGASVGIVVEATRFTHRHRHLVVEAAAETRKVLGRG